MPELDGFELATMIRSHPRFESTAMTFVSAVALTDLDRLRGHACGAVDYVPVPVDPELLRAKVRVFAELYRTTKQLAALMDEATLKRAAEPFFTTKGIGQGTGLGLSMVYGLATQSGGDMRISSAVGTGTTVELWFPLVERTEGEQSESVAAAVGTPAMSCCLLLVDDDAHVAASTTAMLEDLGHTVLAASSGALALDVIRSQGVKIDLVITDHAMPGMTGMELAKHIRQIRPDLPVILATGYADLRNGDDLALPRLAKPYRQAEVADMIETLVRQARAGNVVALSTVKRA
jgi:CheY-like chemotaxis protein